MKRILLYLNPLARLGVKKYSTGFPLFFMVGLALFSELLAFRVLESPEEVGIIAIFLFLVFIIYFAFRDGLRGGFIGAGTTILYYFYIMFDRGYTGAELIAGIETTIALGLAYFLLAGIIGWLKQKIDSLISKETEARKNAEEDKIRLQTILQQLPVGVLLANANGEAEGNKQLEQILGRKIKMQLVMDNKYKSKYVSRSDKPLRPNEWPIVRALKYGETVVGEEMEFRREDHKRLQLRVSAAPIRNRAKQIIAAVSTLYDVTQEKDLERRKDDFVNLASHELKTPLTSMKLYIDLLLKRVKTSQDDRSHKMLQSVKTQTDRLQDLVNDLLDVTRIQTGKLFFNKEEFRLDQLVEETIDMLQETSQEQKIILAKKTAIKVYGDRFRIYQVITNLITNALKYSPLGKNIIIQVRRRDKGALVSVQDFGVGVPKEQQKKIFERLYQVGGTTEKTFPGLGLGLYISREIIKRHKGSIWVEGEKGVGSTFFFTLPLKKAR